MNYDYSRGGKSEPLPKAWRVKGQLEFSARGYNALLVPSGRKGITYHSDSHIHETLAHLYLMRHFLQRKRTRYFRKVNEDFQAQTR